MTRYLLDTSALIDFSKNWEPARSRILQMIQQGDDLGVCAINVSEFYSGIQPDERESWDEFFEALAYWPISRDAARQAGVWRYEYARRGQTLTTTDSLIGAVAMERGAVVLTNNVKHFPMSAVGIQPLT
jgi:predicted nucleic acid-binding protein